MGMVMDSTLNFTSFLSVSPLKRREKTNNFPYEVQRKVLQTCNAVQFSDAQSDICYNELSTWMSSSEGERAFVSQDMIWKSC